MSISNQTAPRIENPPCSTPRGYFIVVEGPNDSGKSSLIVEMVAYFEGLGRKVEVFREPGGSILREILRPILKNREVPIGGFAAALLFNAGRRETADAIIRPKIEDGSILIFDRYIASTEVFQILLDANLTAPEKKVIEDIIDLMPVPDLEIFLQPSPEVIEFRTRAERESGVTAETDRFEGQKRELECYQKVAVAHAAKHPCVIVPIGMGDNHKAVLPKFVTSLEQLLQGEPPRSIRIRYLNWRGQIRGRLVEPVQLVWDQSPYHPGKQWILKARDLEDGSKIKDFCLADSDFLSATRKPSEAHPS